MAKINVAIVFGGKSTEHEVSVISAKGIIDFIDRSKYALSFIYIDHQGQWFSCSEQEYQSIHKDKGKSKPVGKPIAIVPGKGKSCFIDHQGNAMLQNIDVVFPILHGTDGEDGAIQGLMHILDLPFVGTDILGSAVGMDKDVCKRLLSQANITNAAWLCLHAHETPHPDYATVSKQLGETLFVKPANLGSSVGISKVTKAEEFSHALDKAFEYDSKVLVEEAIVGREIECAVMGNEQAKASLPGEIEATKDFYSYDAKYIDSDGAKLYIPANIDGDIIKDIQDMAVRTYQTLGCEGMTRVDFFLAKDNKLYINEVNTIPGFTPISMYPKMWEASGLAVSELIDQLITLAQQRHQQKHALRRSYT